MTEINYNLPVWDLTEIYTDIKDPKIYGAGLLSSYGEAKECLSEKVKKKIGMTMAEI